MAKDIETTISGIVSILIKTVSLALIACLNWGISGFLAGMKNRIMPVLTLLVFSSMASLGMFLIIMGARGVPFPRDPRFLYAVLGGACGVGALYCLYRGPAVDDWRLTSD